MSSTRLAWCYVSRSRALTVPLCRHPPDSTASIHFFKMWSTGRAGGPKYRKLLNVAFTVKLPRRAVNADPMRIRTYGHQWSTESGVFNYHVMLWKPTYFHSDLKSAECHWQTQAVCWYELCMVVVSRIFSVIDVLRTLYYSACEDCMAVCVINNIPEGLMLYIAS